MTRYADDVMVWGDATNEIDAYEKAPPITARLFSRDALRNPDLAARNVGIIGVLRRFLST